MLTYILLNPGGSTVSLKTKKNTQNIEKIILEEISKVLLMETPQKVAAEKTAKAAMGALDDLVKLASGGARNQAVSNGIKNAVKTALTKGFAAGNGKFAAAIAKNQVKNLGQVVAFVVKAPADTISQEALKITLKGTASKQGLMSGLADDIIDDAAVVLFNMPRAGANGVKNEIVKKALVAKPGAQGGQNANRVKVRDLLNVPKNTPLPPLPSAVVSPKSTQLAVVKPAQIAVPTGKPGAMTIGVNKITTKPTSDLALPKINYPLFRAWFQNAAKGRPLALPGPTAGGPIPIPGPIWQLKIPPVWKEWDNVVISPKLWPNWSTVASVATVGGGAVVYLLMDADEDAMAQKPDGDGKNLAMKPSQLPDEDQQKVFGLAFSIREAIVNKSLIAINMLIKHLEKASKKVPALKPLIAFLKTARDTIWKKTGGKTGGKTGSKSAGQGGGDWRVPETKQFERVAKRLTGQKNTKLAVQEIQELLVNSGYSVKDEGHSGYGFDDNVELVKEGITDKNNFLQITRAWQNHLLLSERRITKKEFEKNGIDGKAGKLTIAAVKRFQKDMVNAGYNLGKFGPNKDGVDGIVGKLTFRTLKKYEAGKAKIPKTAQKSREVKPPEFIPPVKDAKKNPAIERKYAATALVRWADAFFDSSRGSDEVAPMRDFIRQSRDVANDIKLENSPFFYSALLKKDKDKLKVLLGDQFNDMPPLGRVPKAFYLQGKRFNKAVEEYYSQIGLSPEAEKEDQDSEGPRIRMEEMTDQIRMDESKSNADKTAKLFLTSFNKRTLQEMSTGNKVKRRHAINYVVGQYPITEDVADLYEAMDGPGTDVKKIKRILKNYVNVDTKSAQGLVKSHFIKGGLFYFKAHALLFYYQGYLIYRKESRKENLIDWLKDDGEDGLAKQLERKIKYEARFAGELNGLLANEEEFEGLRDLITRKANEEQDALDDLSNLGARAKDIDRLKRAGDDITGDEKETKKQYRAGAKDSRPVLVVAREMDIRKIAKRKWAQYNK